MRLMTARAARRDALDAHQDEWERSPPTTTLAERAGHHDVYVLPLPELGAVGRTDGRAARAAEALMTYDIYPPRRMRALVCAPDRRVRPGCLIIQRIFAGPLAIEAAVRVLEVLVPTADDPTLGFSYVTLEGHAERGLARFTLGPDGDGDARGGETRGGQLAFKIESWSRPTGLSGALLAPLSRTLQQRFTREALAHFKAVVLPGQAAVPP